MKIKLALVVILISSLAWSQEEGYFGRKLFLELDGVGSLPLFQNIFVEKGYRDAKEKLVESYDLIDYGFRISLGVVTYQDNANAIEYGYRRYQVNPLKEGELNRQYLQSNGTVKEEYINPRVAFLDLEEHIFMPKVVVVSDFSHIPAGFSNELGIGYTLTSIKNRNPFTEFPSGQGGMSADSVSQNLIDPDVGRLQGMTFMYGFKMNYPLTRSLLFHIGFRYSYNALFGKRKYRKEELSESWLSEREIWSRVNQRRQLGIINFNAGLTFCF